jgi:hypothetical protein
MKAQPPMKEESMALRWDLKPLFRNAPEDSERALWSRRTVISAAAAAVVLTAVATWDVPAWQFFTVVIAVVLAFDAGDHRVPFDDSDDTPYN